MRRVTAFVTGPGADRSRRAEPSRGGRRPRAFPFRDESREKPCSLPMTLRWIRAPPAATACPTTDRRDRPPQPTADRRDRARPPRPRARPPTVVTDRRNRPPTIAVTDRRPPLRPPRPTTDRRDRPPPAAADRCPPTAATDRRDGLPEASESRRSWHRAVSRGACWLGAEPLDRLFGISQDGSPAILGPVSWRDDSRTHSAMFGRQPGT
jgi:hypothetical protein